MRLGFRSFPPGFSLGFSLVGGVFWENVKICDLFTICNIPAKSRGALLAPLNVKFAANGTDGAAKGVKCMAKKVRDTAKGVKGYGMERVLPRFLG